MVTTHGIRGEVKVEPWCDGPEFLLDFDTFYLGRERRPMQVEKSRVHGNMVLIKLKGLDTPEEATKLRGTVIYIDRDDVELEEGEYFIQDIIGLEVVDADDGHTYGKLVDVTENGANQVYHIRFDDEKVQLIPAIPQVVIAIKLEEGRMEIRPLPGLFDDREAVEA
ncbi:MAG: 16S rRNA processing protein RimM [Oscillospiraceae bacterium]|nr:16S rRNA processing protein RimM [Oscillospiraceae bacterium]